ncbi:MAG: type I-C CRISPR-associated protein Cas5c [Clostridiales bacterium]|nr:type I-C CRISPR-associated protein Cas5c [Clostridiales bacterium]
MILAFRLLVYGDYACFTRPEMKAERVSYDVITPSAARGIIDAIYWHPGLRWIVDKIKVLSEIRFDTIRRNELAKKIPYGNIRQAMNGANIDLHQYINTDRQQRATLLLRDPAYVITAHFELNPKQMAAEDNGNKFTDQFTRRARKGQCHHQPYFGTREFKAHFQLLEEGDPMPKGFYDGEACRDLGWMLWDMAYAENFEPNSKDEFAVPKFFRASMQYGVIDTSKGLVI